MGEKVFSGSGNLCVGSSAFSIDIYESDDEYMVEAVLENHDVEDIKVCLSDNELSIIVDEAHKPFIDNKADTIPTQRNIPFPFRFAHAGLPLNSRIPFW